MDCKKRLGQYQHVEHVRNNGFDFCPIDAEELATMFCYGSCISV
jgi:hypothetical protein